MSNPEWDDMPKVKRPKQKHRAIGWIGIVNDKPYFEDTADQYGSFVKRLEVFKQRKEARRRFECVWPVYIGPRSKWGGKK